MSEEDNTFLTPFASNVVKEMSRNEYLNYYSKKFVGPDITELQYRIRKIHTALLDSAIVIGKNQGIKKIGVDVNSEDDRLYDYLTQSCEKLMKSIEDLHDLHHLILEIEVTIHESADSEYLKIYVPEEEA